MKGAKGRNLRERPEGLEEWGRVHLEVRADEELACHDCGVVWFFEPKLR